MSNESMANYITDIPSGIAELLALNKQLKQQLSLMGCEFAEYEKTKKELREAVNLLEKTNIYCGGYMPARQFLTKYRGGQWIV